MRVGWHPLLRIKTGGTFRPAKSVRYRPLRELGPQTGTQGVGTGTAFQGAQRRLNCPLLARWDDGYQAPWVLLTDLAPSAGEAGWQGLRAWIEQGVKITTRGGGPGQPPRMTDPQRAARLWVAVAVAPLGLLSVGGLAEDPIPESTRLPLGDHDGPAAGSRRATRLRLVSVFRRGWSILLMALINQRRLPQGRFKPDPWPLPELSPSQRGTPELRLAA